MTYLLIVISILVVGILFWILGSKKDNNETVSDRRTTISSSAYDEAMKDVASKFTKVDALARSVLSWAQGEELYDWNWIYNSIKVNAEEVVFDYDVCPICNSPLVKILHRNINYEVLLLCQNCKSQFDINKKKLVKAQNIPTNSTQNNTTKILIDDYNNLPDDLKAYFEECSPKTPFLITALNKLGATVSYVNNNIDDDFFLIEYLGKSFVIWVTGNFIIHYPHWYSIEKNQFTDEIISIIQNQNQNSRVCSYWLGDKYQIIDKAYNLSSNIVVDFSGDVQDFSEYLKCHLDNLIKSSESVIHAIETRNQQLDSNCPSPQLPNDFISILETNNLDNVKQDEDGNVHFVFQEKEMYARAIEDDYIRLFYPYIHLQNVGEESLVDADSGDSMALQLQYNNMISVYKCSYNKRESATYDVCLYVDIKSSALQQIGAILSYYHNFSEGLFMDIIFAAEDAIDYINSRTIPQVYNFK